MSEDTGVVSVYYKMPDSAIHAHRPDGQLEQALYAKFSDLRQLWAAEIGEPWSVASYSLELPRRFSLDFAYDDVSDVGGAMDRRSVWEKKHFGDAPIAVTR